MDEIARTTLKESNDALEKEIDRVIIENKYSRRIALLDEVQFSSGAKIDVTSPYTTISQNYMFGLRTTEIRDPLQCTISRGSSGTTSQFGRSQLVEANTAFDILSTQSQIEQLKIDTEILVRLGKPNCFPASKPKTDSYWGDNSILRIVG